MFAGAGQLWLELGRVSSECPYIVTWLDLFIPIKSNSQNILGLRGNFSLYVNTYTSVCERIFAF